MTSGEHERTGGVRGAINDLLGLGERRGERDADRRAEPDTPPGPSASQPYADQAPGDPAPGDQTRGDQPYGDQVHGDQARGDQPYSDQARGDEPHVPVDQPYGDQARGDQPYADGAPAGAANQPVDDPGAVRTDRFDAPPAEQVGAVDDGRQGSASGPGGLFEREDEVPRGRAGESVAAPQGAAGTGVTDDPRLNPDVPAQARPDATPPGQAGPRHELLGQDDGLREEQVHGLRDQSVGETGVHDDTFARSGEATGAGGVATVTEPARTDQATGAPAGTPADTTTGTGVPATAGGSPASVGTDEEGRERLVPAERATDYGTRWDQIKGEFVDEPRQAVSGADALVGELLDELQTLFAEQRQSLDRGFDADEASTEDLRLALRRYRSFFDRLLSI